MKRLHNSKRGANASGAGTFIFIVGFFIILYILFLPSSVINPSFNSSSGGAVIEPLPQGSSYLLNVNPGLLLSPKHEDFKLANSYNLDSLIVEVKSQASIIKKENPFVVSANLFSNNQKQIIFNIPDVSKYNSVILSFNSPKHKGILHVELNGYDVASFEMSSLNAPPIDLTDYLVNGKNILILSVSKGFFASNYYDIDDLKITATVTDTSKAKAVRTFNVPRDVLSNFDSASLSYLVECGSTDGGNLDVEINGYNLSYGVPDCDSPKKIDFPASQLTAGTNFLTFKTDHGVYSVYGIKITPTIKQVNLPTYFFDLPPKTYGLVKNGSYELVLNMTFADNNYKEGKIYINGYLTGFSTRDNSFGFVLDNDTLKEYYNSVKIVPSTNVDITSLTVKLEKKKNN